MNKQLEEVKFLRFYLWLIERYNPKYVPAVKERLKKAETAMLSSLKQRLANGVQVE